MRLSTGKEFTIGGGGDQILGISADLEVTEGYDTNNTQWDGDRDDFYDHETHDPSWLTQTEKIEVCDMMIKRWSDLRQRLVTETLETK